MSDGKGERPSSWVKDLLTSLAATAVLLLVVAGAGEAYFRLTRPFLTGDWPLTFVDDVGLLFTPGGVARATNGLDFWTQQTANSQGFLAEEPRVSDPKACRIAVIGDSFVSALEVQIEQKLPRQLMNLAAAQTPPLDLAVAAYGYGGTGQLNQLPFYDKFARAFRPRIVLLVFVGNDFANNSAVLEGIRGGIDPDHPHRMYARRTASGGFEPLPVDNKGWRSHLLEVPTRTRDFIPRVNTFLVTHSYFYSWIFTKLTMVAPQAAAWLSGQDMGQLFRERARLLAKRPGNETLLEGWDPARNTSTNATMLSMDAPFSWPQLPPAFQQAMAFSGYALDEFKARATRDGASLVILSIESMRMDEPTGLRFKRLKELADPRGIPVIDMYDYMERKKLPVADASFAHDGHWTPAGHAAAAQAVLEYLDAHRDLCVPPVGGS